MTKKQVVPVLVKPILRGPVCVGYTTIKMVVEPLTFVLFKVIGVLPQSLSLLWNSAWRGLRAGLEGV